MKGNKVIIKEFCNGKYQVWTEDGVQVACPKDKKWESHFCSQLEFMYLDSWKKANKLANYMRGKSIVIAEYAPELEEEEEGGLIPYLLGFGSGIAVGLIVLLLSIC